MNSFVIALLFGAGAGAWVYSKVMKRNGSQTKQALFVGGFVGVLGMIVFYTIFATIAHR